MFTKKIRIESTEVKKKIPLPRTYTRLWIELLSGEVKVYLNDSTAYDELVWEGDAFELPMSTVLKYPHEDEVYVEGEAVLNVEYESELN